MTYQNVVQVKLDGDGDTVMSVAGIVAAIRGKIDEPYIDLSGEYWALQNYPKEELQHGRDKEVKNLIKFDTYDELDTYEGKSYDMVWVDEWRGDKVRSRLVVRQFNTEGPAMTSLQRPPTRSS